MSQGVYTQLVALCAGTLLLTSVLLVWRRSLRASIRLLALQGFALGLLVVVIGIEEKHAEVIGVAVLVALLKGWALPGVLSRRIVQGTSPVEDSVRFNPIATLLAVAFLTTLAYVVSRPLTTLGDDPAIRAVPIGITVVLIGFLMLVTRRHALSALVGLLLIDNGIAAVAFLTTGGVPLVVELGVSLDVLLVVLILHVMTGRMQVKFGHHDVTELTELRD